MCLITTFGKGFIAKENITVYKKLKTLNSRWFTSCRGWGVELDSMLTSDKSSPEITNFECPYIYGINGGVIHSYATTKVYTCNPSFLFKAIIPEGTRFWIKDDLSEVASERLYLTSEMVTENLKTDFSSLFSEYCLDLLLNNGERIKWSEIDITDIKGIFTYGSQAIGLNTYEGILPNLPDQILDRKKAEKDMKGRKRTKYLRENYPKIEILKDLPEDSYIPSCGELSKALENFLFINLTRKALGLKILECKWFLSSTPSSNDSNWYVHPGCSWLGWCYNSNRYSDMTYILPFLDLKENKRLSWIKSIYNFFRKND